jgi:hypothetical protein
VFLLIVVPNAGDDAGRNFQGTIREDAESGDEVVLDHELRMSGERQGMTCIFCV